MAINLSALSNFSTAAQALSNLILVTPQQVIGYQPQSTPTQDGNVPQQPPAILFHYEGEQTVNLKSDITDHFIEDNTAIQDQIALRPETITTHGFIGELNDVTPSVLKPLKTAAEKLTVIGAYTPQLTETALLAYNNAQFLYSTAQNAANAAIATWSSITGQGGQSVINGQGITVQANQTKQQLAFQQFYGYWRTRTLFTVQTPWAVFQNMAIESLTPIQDDSTRMVTDFNLTFKLLRFASTITTLGNIGVIQQSRSVFQSGTLLDLGASTGTPGPNVLTQITASGIG